MCDSKTGIERQSDAINTRIWPQRGLVPTFKINFRINGYKDCLDKPFDIAIDMNGQGRPDLASVRPGADAFDIYVHDNFLLSIPRDGTHAQTPKKSIREAAIVEIKEAINRHYQEEVLSID